MAVYIKGDNNGIAVGGNLTIEKLDFEFGKGVRSASGVAVGNMEDAEIIPITIEEAVKASIQYVMDIKEDDEYIFKYQPQWAGIFVVLAYNGIVDRTAYTAFGTYIDSLNLGKLRVKPIDKDLRKYMEDIPNDLQKWNDNPEDIQAHRIFIVADRFRQKLEEFVIE